MAVSASDINPSTGKAYAINPSSGVWDDNYFASNFGGGSGGSSGGNDIASLARQQMQMYQEANKPVVQSLEAQIPTIGQKYAQTGQYLQKQVTSLDDRYKSLLDSIKGLQQNDVQAVTTNTSQELGRRGISAESGLFGKTINEAVQPVNRGYAGQISQLGATQQSALDSLLNQIAGLPTQQTQEEQAVRTAIAQLQAGGNTQGITQALQMYQQNQDNAFRNQEAQRAADLQKAQLDYSSKLQPIELALKQAELNKAQQSGKGSVSLIDQLSQIQKMFGGTTTSEPKPTTGKPVSSAYSTIG